jgi:MFS superfamily sulfate permease-like transporter
MNDDLDRMLMEREEIVPSSGFVASVMDAVRQEAAAPAPIPFPWKWALPGFVVSVALAVGMIARWVYSGATARLAVHPVATALPMETLSSSLPQVHMATSTLVALEWSALAILGSLAAVWISMRIAGAKE